MIALTGVSHAQYQDLLKLLISNHRISIRVQLLDLNNNYVADLSKRLLSGQVTVDATADVTRVLQMELLDPKFNMGLDSTSPVSGSMYLDRQVRIIYVVSDVMMTRSYDIPLFVGPITKLDRTDAVVALECSGKERLANGGIWVSKTYKKGKNKTDVMKDVFKKIVGETKLNIPDKSAKFPKPYTLTRQSVVWDSLRNIAAGMSYRLFYDARGVATMRDPGGKSVYNFTLHGAILSQPQISYDNEILRNAVEVIGAKPKGHKKHVHGTAVAPRAHPLSPKSLGRNGVYRYFIETVNNPSLRTNAGCAKYAAQLLERYLVLGTTVTFDSLPIPLLEENDVCTVTTKTFSTNFYLTKFTIPLVAGEVSNIGYTRKVTPNRMKIRRK